MAEASAPRPLVFEVGDRVYYVLPKTRRYPLRCLAATVTKLGKNCIVIQCDGSARRRNTVASYLSREPVGVIL